MVLHDFGNLLEKNVKDPAISGGPFTTVVKDILSLPVYFAIAGAVLGIAA